jgi:rRNA processing protein Krr1/Pno1
LLGILLKKINFYLLKVVGPKGTTIKRIQQLTHTYIVTPSRDKEPVFEVTGLPENVQVAKKEIESHIATRTAEPALGSVGFYEENYFNRYFITVLVANLTKLTLLYSLSNSPCCWHLLFSFFKCWPPRA